MTSISEFERNKPRKTYAAISDLETELEACLNFGMNVIDTDYILNKVRNIKKIFVSGE